MTTRPLYPRDRASAPVDDPGGKRPGYSDYDLIAQLRAVRDEGNEAMTAAEQYDPDFGIKLSSCANEAEAEQLLDEWLARRVDVLRRTRAHLRQVWKAARPKSDSG